MAENKLFKIFNTVQMAIQSIFYRHARITLEGV